MGLFRIAVREDRIKTIPEAMHAAGFPITRIEREGDQTYYYFVNPKQKTEINFCLTDAGENEPSYLMMGISKTYKQIADLLKKAGILECGPHLNRPL